MSRDLKSSVDQIHDRLDLIIQNKFDSMVKSEIERKVNDIRIEFL